MAPSTDRKETVAESGPFVAQVWRVPAHQETDAGKRGLAGFYWIPVVMVKERGRASAVQGRATSSRNHAANEAREMLRVWVAKYGDRARAREEARADARSPGGHMVNPHSA